MKNLSRTSVLGPLLVSICTLLVPGVAFAGCPVNVNTADATQLSECLDGVGDKTAAGIITYRDEHGPFETLDELKNVKGIGDKLIENNKEDIRFTD